VRASLDSRSDVKLGMHPAGPFLHGFAAENAGKMAWRCVKIAFCAGRGFFAVALAK